jgi:hypothetical protein
MCLRARYLRFPAERGNVNAVPLPVRCKGRGKRKGARPSYVITREPPRPKTSPAPCPACLRVLALSKGAPRHARRSQIVCAWLRCRDAPLTGLRALRQTRESKAGTEEQALRPNRGTAASNQEGCEGIERFCIQSDRQHGKATGGFRCPPVLLAIT